jgi:NAD+ synthase
MNTLNKRNLEKETERIVQFIQETFKNKGFSKAVLGISGGIDSAVVCALLVKALGKENIYGYILPCGEQHDIEDAKKLCRDLGVNYNIINIEPIFNSFLDALSYEKDDKISQGNIKARIRMIMLYDMSAFYTALVVGTSNKTELKLGYFTLYGDGACALEPIGHLYKTDVFKLAKYLKVPEEIINKAPSAGLWVGQTDEQELGANYKEIDEFLSDFEKPFCSIKRHRKKFDFIIDRIEKNKFKLEPPKILED